MSMIKSQILKFVDLRKTQKSRFLENETFFFRIRKIITHQVLCYDKKQFVMEVIFKLENFVGYLCSGFFMMPLNITGMSLFRC